MKVGKAMVMVFLGLVLSSCAGQQQTSEPAPETTTETVTETTTTTTTTTSSDPETAALQRQYAGVGRLEGVSLDTVRLAPPVASGYENVVVNPVVMSSQFRSDYPDAGDLLQSSMVRHLKDKKSYRYVATSDYSDRQPQGRTLTAEITIIDMRIVSGGARMWAGPMAGASYMELYLKLTDAATKEVVHEKVIATSNNAFASAWAMGSEQSLPLDMGKIIGEYLATVAPAQ